MTYQSDLVTVCMLKAFLVGSFKTVRPQHNSTDRHDKRLLPTATSTSAAPSMYDRHFCMNVALLVVNAERERAA
jgi:hypothetical protein